MGSDLYLEAMQEAPYRLAAANAKNAELRAKIQALEARILELKAQLGYEKESCRKTNTPVP